MLLLDEPFGALDAKVRKELRRWLRRLHDEMHVTSVFVTHDQEEALEVADRVVVMNHGRIEQIGTPREVYDRAGDAVRLQLPRRREPLPRPGRGRLRCASATISLPHERARISATASRWSAFARPHELEIVVDGRRRRTASRPRSTACSAAAPAARVELVANGARRAQATTSRSS